MIGNLQYLAAGLTMIGVLVVIHEFGHFLFAKLFGIGVPVFSVGMGPRLFGLNFKGTDYRVSLLPIGGYVQMSGADPFGEEDAHSRVDPDLDFMKKPVWQRLIVMFAGPAFNLILPFIVFTAVLMLGDPQPPAVVGYVVEGSPAESVGLEVGDRVLTADGESIEVFSDLVRHLDDHATQPITLGIERDGAPRQVVLPVGSVRRTFDGLLDLEAIGIFSSFRSSRIGVDDPTSPAWVAGLRTGDLITEIDGQPVELWDTMITLLTPDRSHTVKGVRVDEATPQLREPLEFVLNPDPTWSAREGDYWRGSWGLVPVINYVGRVMPDSAAAAAGMESADRLFAIDGTPVRSWSDLNGLVARSMDGRTQEQGPRTIAITVVREGELKEVVLAPRITREIVGAEIRYRPLMGVERYPSGYVPSELVQKYYSVFEAVPLAVEQGATVLQATFGVLYKLITFDLKPQEALGGPVEIFRAAGQSAEAGLFSFAKLLGTISFSLGIVNLLPVPVLDGGQILFYAIEGIRGRPLSLDLREKVQMVGVLGLAALMLMVTVMDVNRWLSG